MNLSDDSSSDDSQLELVPAKRPRANTYGASSTTSHGSVIQESDEELPDVSPGIDNFTSEFKHQKVTRLNYAERVSQNNTRSSQSSFSENCSSPTDDDYRPAFEDNDGDEELSVRTGLGNNDSSFYNKKNDNKSYPEKSRNKLSNNLGYKPNFKTSDTTIVGAYSDNPKRGKNKTHFASSKHETGRTSQSSFSENCSSPTDDDYRPTFDDNDGDDDLSMQPSFKDNNDSSFYNNKANEKSRKSVGFKSNFHESDTGIASGYSEKSKRIMDKMGFTPGKGLGKHETGRTEPVEASTQKGRRGLGLKPSAVGELPTDLNWSPDDLKPEAREIVSWMPTPPEDPVSGDLLDEWLKRGEKKLTLDDENEFVESRIIKGVLDAKTLFDTLDDEDLRNARFRSNPYETIGSVIFLNRAAVKMANLDAVFDFMFTQPKKQNGESFVDKKEILYFADVCAGPGGFSEYILYKKKWKAKGFGFTLKGPCDFKLSDFYAGTPETFNPYYGVKDDGNIFDPENLSSLKDHVLKNTDDKGVHFLMADGGFSVDGQKNIQEILSKQLYLCQCLAALMLVRTGGSFVVKLFDVFTLFSVGLVYIMYRCFDKVAIHKPVTSRPANSERYLVCKWKKLGTDSVERHLFYVNSLLWRGLREGEDVTELVPLHVIQEDRDFYEYIFKSNCVLGELQIKNLLKIADFSKNKSLNEDSQAEMRMKCLEFWQLPDKVRTQPERLHADDTMTNVISLMKKPPPESSNTHNFKANILNAPSVDLEKASDLPKLFKNVYDWHFMILSSNKKSSDLKFFLSCGGKQVYQLDGTRWTGVVDLHITMPAKTLLYGELVKEFRGEGNPQMHSKALHVIDAAVLGGVDISHLPLSERLNQCALFCAAIEKPFDKQALPVRCKRIFNMESFSSAISNLEYRQMKRGGRAVTIDTPNRNRDGMFYSVGSVLFLKEIKEPWIAQISKSSGCKYYYSVINNKPRSEYIFPKDAQLDVISAFCSRVMWCWGEPAKASAIFDGLASRCVSRTDMENFVYSFTKR